MMKMMRKFRKLSQSFQVKWKEGEYYYIGSPDWYLRIGKQSEPLLIL